MSASGRSVNWIIKLSKLCNLRCGYCYEWNELGDPRRMGHELFGKVLEAARELHSARMRAAPDVRTVLIMHGGEPLVLPVDYTRQFLENARDSFVGLNHEIRLQTNLLHITNAQIELLRKFGVGLGVSYDVVPGVRLTVDGRESERRVEENMGKLRDAGVPFSAIVVVAKHTVPHLRRIYDYFAGRGVMLKVLPLSDGPDERPLDTFSVPFDQVIASLCDLFDHWFESGLAVTLDPFRGYLTSAIRFLLNVPAQKYDRGVSGDYALFVNVDGRLYAERDAYDVPLALGDLNTQRMVDVLASSAYKASLRREAALIDGKCSSCPLDRTCNGWPIVSTKSRGLVDEPCSVAPVVISHIARRLTEWGFDRDELENMRISADTPAIPL